MHKFSRAAVLLVLTMAALAFAGIASAADGYTLFGTGTLVSGEDSPHAIQATADGISTFGGVSFPVPDGLTVGGLNTLATDYRFTAGSCGAGSPRFSAEVQDGSETKALFFYVGQAPSYAGCPANAWAASGNLAAPSNLVDAMQIGGAFYMPYSLVQLQYGSLPVTGIELVADGSGGAQTVQFDNSQVNSTTVDYNCFSTGFVRDGIDLTAAQINGTVTGTLDATGCNIGAYNPDSVDGADISGANYFGVVEDGHAGNVNGATIHDIGEAPFNGTQHGVAVYYTGSAAQGTIAGNTISNYQKGGIVVTSDASATLQGNTVTGLGGVDFIAQNGIQISLGATAQLTGNDVSANDYTPPKIIACGLLLYQAGGIGTRSLGALKQANDFHDNENDVCNVGKG